MYLKEKHPLEITSDIASWNCVQKYLQKIFKNFLWEYSVVSTEPLPAIPEIPLEIPSAIPLRIPPKMFMQFLQMLLKKMENYEQF